MGRIAIIGAVVLAVWVGLEIQNKGIEGAFNGLFAPAGQAEAEAAMSAPQRAGNAVLEAHREADERQRRALGE
ncbi:MAG TPA: hypothetical protein VEC18_10905 [Myxococcota bacterium]|nr:hypothetical protein [Myxococcota bacterium]